MYYKRILRVFLLLIISGGSLFATFPMDEPPLRYGLEGKWYHLDDGQVIRIRVDRDVVLVKWRTAYGYGRWQEFYRVSRRTFENRIGHQLIVDRGELRYYDDRYRYIFVRADDYYRSRNRRYSQDRRYRNDLDRRPRRNRFCP